MYGYFYFDNTIYQSLLQQMQIFYRFKRGGGKGCAGFTGCAQLEAGQSALQAMIHANRASLFGSGGPGKRKRSAEQQPEQEA